MKPIVRGWQDDLFTQGVRKRIELKTDGDYWRLLSPKSKERYLQLKRKKAGEK